MFDESDLLTLDQVAGSHFTLPASRSARAASSAFFMEDHAESNGTFHVFQDHR
jgi:hypothetical protein